MLSKVQVKPESYANQPLINTMPLTERPREKLLASGPNSLSDAELLAIFLRTGVKGCSVVTLANLLIEHFGSLHQLLEAPISKLTEINGLGLAKSAQLSAIIELAKRYLSSDLVSRPTIHSADDAKMFLQMHLRDQKTEQFMVVYLDQQNGVKHQEVLFSGTINQAAVYPREVVKSALDRHAVALIVAHNHPSGNCRPSAADLRLTQTLKDALSLVDINLLDHLIIAGDKVYSFAESNDL